MISWHLTTSLILGIVEDMGYMNEDMDRRQPCLGTCQGSKGWIHLWDLGSVGGLWSMYFGRVLDPSFESGPVNASFFLYTELSQNVISFSQDSYRVIFIFTKWSYRSRSTVVV